MYSLKLSVRSGTELHGGDCRSSYIGRQNSKNPCSLPLTFPHNDRSVINRLLQRGIAGPDGWRPQHQTRGLELANDHETGNLLCNYSDENSCLIFEPVIPNTNPYNPSSTPDYFDIVIARDLPFLVYLTSYSPLSLDQLPVLIDTTFRSFFQYPRDRHDFRRTDWINFQTHMEDDIPFDLELHNGVSIDTCVENFSGDVLQTSAASTPKWRPRAGPRPPIPADIQDEIRLMSRQRWQWQVARVPTVNADVHRLQKSLTRRFNEWRNI